MKFIITALIGVFALPSWSEAHVAIVKSLRGEVVVSSDEGPKSLKEKDLVKVGSVLKSNEGGFVSLVFQDNTQLSLAPSSEIKITEYEDKKPGVIDLNKGQARAIVSGEETERLKLIIKTPLGLTAVSDGEFLVTYLNSQCSSIVFSGEAFFNRTSLNEIDKKIDLGKISEEGVLLKSGEFSVLHDGVNNQPASPSLLNILQKELLARNIELNKNSSPFNSDFPASNLIVPEGLSGKLVSNDFEVLNSELGFRKNATARNSEGMNNRGAFLKLETGQIILPGSRAVFDSNTNSFLPVQDQGSVAIDGNYLMPVSIGILDTQESQDKGLKQYKAKSFSYELDKRFPANAGIKDVNDPQRFQSEYSGTTIRLRDN
jgi:hypothetical protein